MDLDGSIFNMYNSIFSQKKIRSYVYTAWVNTDPSKSTFNLVSIRTKQKKIWSYMGLIQICLSP